MKSRTSLKLYQDGVANNIGVSIETIAADTIKVNDTVYELTPQSYKALSSTGYSGSERKEDSNNFFQKKFFKTIFDIRLMEMESTDLKILFETNSVKNQQELNLSLKVNLMTHNVMNLN